MDPNAAFSDWERASTEADAIVAAKHLVAWLDRGGFEPTWTVDERGQFMFWCLAASATATARVPAAIKHCSEALKNILVANAV